MLKEDSVRNGEAGPAKARPPPRRETTDIHGVDREKTVGEKRADEKETGILVRDKGSESQRASQKERD